MKRMLYLVSSALFFTACAKTLKTDELLTEKPVTKTIEFTLVPATDYSAAYYDSSTAEIKLTIYKPLSDPYREQIIWDTTIARQALKEYLNPAVPPVISKTFVVFDNKEKLGAGYSISYITQPFDLKSWSAFGGLAERGNTIFKVAVTL